MPIGRRLAPLALAACLGALAGAPAHAADRHIQLKLSHWVPPSHPLQAAIQAWADSIKADSHGSITSVIFPAEQLGKAVDHYDMTRDGIADGAYVNPGYQPGRFPIIAAGDIPFTFSDAVRGTEAIDAWYRQYAAREMHDVKYCFAFILDPATLHTKRRVVVPADVKGMTLRPADGTIGTWVTLMGGTNVQASAPGSRDLLERGVAQGIFFPWGSLVLFGMDHVTKYHIDAPMYVSTFVWVLNQARYDSMAPDQKAVIDNHCNAKWADRFAGPWAKFEEAGRAKVAAEPGQVLVKLTPAQLALWKQSAEPLHADWARGVRRAGLDPKQVYAGLEAEIAKHNAGY
ncbi:MAG TPA: TRAP transporter substrate-binding protein [Acetobacteraceae bacterium]|nr:TRAP transporter substrate-binding protein [Acetobacteraceae bacterium]